MPIFKLKENALHQHGSGKSACRPNHFRKGYVWLLASGAAAIFTFNTLRADGQSNLADAVKTQKQDTAASYQDPGKFDKKMRPFFRIRRGSRKGEYGICELNSNEYGLNLVFSTWNPERTVPVILRFPENRIFPVE